MSFGRCYVGFAWLLVAGCGSSTTETNTGTALRDAAAGGATTNEAGEDAAPPGVESEDGGTLPPVDVDAATDATDASTSGMGPYGANGPVAFTSTTLQVPAPNGAFSTTAYVPSGTTPMPVVILSSGLQQPGAAYAPYAERLASWGIVTFLRDDPGVIGEASPAIASDVSYMVTTWLAATSTASTSPLAGKIDTTRIGLAGHSRGGQVALLAAEGGAHGLVRGMFGLDPVDSAGDGGIGLAAAGIAGIGVPLAFIGETTDSAASSCAPSSENYIALYGVASSPAVALTAVGADHTMFEVPASCQFCALCTAGKANAAQVLAEAQRYLMAFFARELLGDASVGATFAGAGVTQDIAAGVVQLQSK